MNHDAARELVLELAFSRSDLEFQLEASKGMQDGTEVFRPFWVASLFWRTSQERRLIKGDGAEFENVDELVAGLLAQQRIADTGVTIPVGYEASQKSVQQGTVSSVPSVVLF